MLSGTYIHSYIIEETAYFKFIVRDMHSIRCLHKYLILLEI